MNRLIVFLAVGAFLLALKQRQAQAGPVTWEFEGEVTLVHDPNELLHGEVESGSPFAATVKFDPTTPGNGLFNNVVMNAFGTIGASTIAGPLGPTNSILVFNDIPYDTYSIKFDVNVQEIPLVIQLFFADEEGAMLQSSDLLPMPPSFDILEVAEFHLFVADSEAFGINGTLTNIRFVPEPTCGSLVLFGALVGLTRRAR